MNEDKIWFIAAQVAQQINCKKRAVGCVITDADFNILSTGFNTHPDGICDCNSTKTARHAEIAALKAIPAMSKPRHAFITHRPCRNCIKALTNAGLEIHIKEISEVKRKWKQKNC